MSENSRVCSVSKSQDSDGNFLESKRGKWSLAVKGTWSVNVRETQITSIEVHPPKDWIPL